MKSLFCLTLFVFVATLSACAMAPPVVPNRTELRPARIQAHGPAPVRHAMRDRLTSAPLTLEAAIETALLNNPSLKADFAAFEAAALDVPQVSSLPDPRVTYTQFVKGVQTRSGEQQFIAGVSQMFPWFGKLRLQGAVARAGAMQVLEGYRATMLDVRHQVQSAWYRLAYEQAALTLAQQDRATIERTIEAAAALYGAGKRGRGTLLQSQAELARIENELTGYPARIEALRQELARLLFVDAPIAIPALEDVPLALNEVPEAETLIAQALDLRPEIARLRLGEEKAQLLHELARKDSYPDFTIGVSAIGIGSRPDVSGSMAPSDEGEDAWSANIGFNIPIPNARRRAAREQALRQGDEARWRRKAVESQIEEQAHAVRSRLTALQRQLAVLQGSLLPLAEEAEASNLAAYTSGQATFLELLDAQRTLISVRRDDLKTRRDLLLTLADLERLGGGSLAPEVHP